MQSSGQKTHLHQHRQAREQSYNTRLVGWLVDVFCIDDSWTPVTSAVELSLQIFNSSTALGTGVQLLSNQPTNQPIWCYKIVFGLVDVDVNDFFVIYYKTA